MTHPPTVGDIVLLVPDQDPAIVTRVIRTGSEHYALVNIVAMHDMRGSRAYASVPLFDTLEGAARHCAGDASKRAAYVRSRPLVALLDSRNG